MKYSFIILGCLTISKLPLNAMQPTQLPEKKINSSIQTILAKHTSHTATSENIIFACSYCTQGFYDNFQLILHMRYTCHVKKTLNKNIRQSSIYAFPLSTWANKCPKCRRKEPFASRSEYLEHMFDDHGYE